uniref:Uncharacterized protein n=1 Tax=Faecalibaculum rodentium TaxID=1702221 RepID=A0A140DRE8_9FIRM|nr:hypothetical protein AALO17_00910 [Faecalibaculum rodentium]
MDVKNKQANSTGDVPGIASPFIVQTAGVWRQTPGIREARRSFNGKGNTIQTHL